MSHPSSAQHRRVRCGRKSSTRLLSCPTGSCGRLHAPVSLESRPHGHRLALRTFLGRGAEPAHELFEELAGLGVGHQPLLHLLGERRISGSDRRRSDMAWKRVDMSFIDASCATWMRMGWLAAATTPSA